MGKPVIMGRKTYESIGRPLPGRHNIVVSRNARFRAGGCTVVTSVDLAVVAAGDAEEVMVIGGEQVYRMFLPLADRVYMTRVHADVKGDARFPELDDAAWSLVGREEHAADADNEFAFTFEVYKRIR